MASLFTEDMSYMEALNVFYANTEGKTKEEIEELSKELDTVMPTINKREMDGSFTLTSYQI